MLKGLVGSKSLTREDMECVLDKMRDHLIGESEQGRLVFGGSGWWGRRAVMEVVHSCRGTHPRLSPSLAKNVAADIAVQLCESVANKLEGKVMGTFSSKCLPRPGSAWVEVMKSPPFLLRA